MFYSDVVAAEQVRTVRETVRKQTGKNTKRAVLAPVNSYHQPVLQQKATRPHPGNNELTFISGLRSIKCPLWA